jgi:hypothetical protein
MHVCTLVCREALRCQLAGGSADEAAMQTCASEMNDFQQLRQRLQKFSATFAIYLFYFSLVFLSYILFYYFIEDNVLPHTGKISLDIPIGAFVCFACERAPTCGTKFLV